MMSDISDELRKLADSYGSGNYNVLYDFAYRIDAEMVELPRDMDGETIHLGDKIFDLNGDEQAVSALYLLKRKDPTWMVNVGFGAHVSPRDLTHKPKDSLERIASDMGAEIESLEISRSDGDALDTLRDYMERIKVLAERECGGDERI